MMEINRQRSTMRLLSKQRSFSNVSNELNPYHSPPLNGRPCGKYRKQRGLLPIKYDVDHLQYQ